ncbi:MAG: hypothetical protein JO286_02480 [Solirubrobacterales bacterium]|nr:hypothetical protein [Solirubrobacterales bacterium]MBV9365995.1 hypothetical protein [Solirubrobacterales bacterium]MBV9806017.1 hypothetical protein [Solirubrobacterales bacterium]
MARDDEAARYREAAHLTLDQLEWCIEYLRTIRKTRIANVLARNRSAIARGLEESDDGSSGRISAPGPNT